MFYIANTPFWLKSLFPRNLIWRGPAVEKTVYLTFDDGPHPVATPFVLDQLAQFGAKATFFCIGKNVVAHPEIYTQVLAEGHGVGNHTMTHLNGKSATATAYADNYRQARQHIDTDLFRPPYGRINAAQLKSIKQLNPSAQVVMWSVLCGDFDTSIDGEHCSNLVKRYTKPGAIVVFHDSAKALPRLRVALPLVLAWLADRGWAADKL